MADRKQFYLMYGIPTFENVAKSVKVKGGKIELQYSNEVMNLFYDYFLDEKERAIAATELREEYLDKETTPERKAIIKDQFVLNYHYTGNLDLSKGNAYHFQHFKAFNQYKNPRRLNQLSKKEVLVILTDILNKNFEKEYKYASKIGAIIRDGTELDFGAMNSTKGRNLEAELEGENTTSEAVSRMMADFMINNMMSIIEAEKVFFADPAFFKRDSKDSTDVADDLYKRWFGVGSTGAEMATSTESYPDQHFNVITLNTQQYESQWYPVIYDKHVALYKKAGMTEAAAKKRASFVLKAFGEVDPTDGQMIVSPDMFRSMSTRLGQWSDSKQDAYELLMSEGDLTLEQEIDATGIIMQPLKTVYVGKQSINGMDVVIYDKMSMATIFRRQVKDTPMEDVLDRMESVGQYEGLEKVHAFKYDTVVKLGGRPGIDLFTDKNVRHEVSNLSEVTVHKQYFEHLKHQVVTDAHDIVRQTVGSQAYKVITSNIVKQGVAYGNYESGEALLEAVTSARGALSRLWLC